MLRLTATQHAQLKRSMKKDRSSAGLGSQGKVEEGGDGVPEVELVQHLAGGRRQPLGVGMHTLLKRVRATVVNSQSQQRVKVGSAITKSYPRFTKPNPRFMKSTMQSTTTLNSKYTAQLRQRHPYG